MIETVRRRIVKRDRGPLVDIFQSRALMLGAQIRRPKSQKFWKRAHVIRAFAKGGRGVEIGVHKGEFAQILLEECLPERAWFIDPWDSREEIFRIASERLGKYPNAVVIKEKSQNVVDQFEDESLDWIYIDGDHSYEKVLSDLRDWTPKIRSGGTIAGDDFYLSRPHIGEHPVKRAFDDFLATGAPVRRWFVVAGQFVIVKA